MPLSGLSLGSILEVPIAKKVNAFRHYRFIIHNERMGHMNNEKISHTLDPCTFY
jgi:hypothetical protein